MQFNSYSYLLFLTLSVSLFWLLTARARRWWVLGASLAFYASWSIAFVVLPLAVCLTTYVCATRMQGRPDHKKRWLRIGIAVALVALAAFKYNAFIAGNLGPLARPAAPALLALARIGLPLGISFYSFEAVSYLLDTYQDRISKVTFLDLCLFVVFWPHLIAGPIVRGRELIPQLTFTRPFAREDILTGLDRFVWGLVQKNVFANSLASWIDTGFAPAAARLNTSIDNWALAIAFGLQIYFDFAAYSNMAIGAARMIGVQLPENFNYPYLAWSPADFWSRWHMTLSRWIRDYLFFPLTARFARTPGVLYLSLVAVMAVVGLWHGAGWGFVLWGIMHGLYLVSYRSISAARTRRQKADYGWRGRLAWRVVTLVAVTAAWVPFRASGFPEAAAMLRSMFARPTIGFTYSVNSYLVTLLIAACCAAEPWLARAYTRFEAAIGHSTAGAWTHLYLLRPALYALGLLLFVVFDDRDVAFIYFQF